jgi:hypothetical protein
MGAMLDGVVKMLPGEVHLSRSGQRVKAGLVILVSCCFTLRTFVILTNMIERQR